MDKTYRLHRVVDTHLLELKYYQNLSGPGRSRFRNRVIQFINSKVFIGRDGLEVTTEMMVWVSAAAVQLTFGLKEFILPRYTKILLYPESFYYSLSRQWMKGYTATKDRIALSWADFKDGYADSNDNYNLGLHELAHALHLSLMDGSDTALEFYFAKWEDQSHSSFQALQKGTPSFLRKYGGRNKHEFFAVCVEHFFESPEDLKRELPDVFYHMAMVLYQDVTNHEMDYEINQQAIALYNKTAEFPLPVKSKWGRPGRTYRYREWHWTLSITMFGLFISTIIFMNLEARIMLPTSSMLMAIGVLAILAFFHRPILEKKDVRIAPPILALYGIFGIGINIMTIVVLLNLFVNVETHKEKHVIENLRRISPGKYVYQLEDGKYLNYPECRRAREGRKWYSKGDTLEMKFGTGVTGLPVFLGNKLIHRDKSFFSQN